jgi:hypothetical protein
MVHLLTHLGEYQHSLVRMWLELFIMQAEVVEQVMQQLQHQSAD